MVGDPKCQSSGGGDSLGGGGKNISKGDGKNLLDIKWSKPLSLEAAKKCNSRSEFKSRYGIAYRFARENGILNKLFPK